MVAIRLLHLDTGLPLNNADHKPGNTENYPINHVGSDHRYASSRRLMVTPHAIVGGLRRISKATANARDAAEFTLPFSLLVRNSYGVKNTRLTIRRFPRSFVILANYPARASAHTDRPTVLTQV